MKVKLWWTTSRLASSTRGDEVAYAWGRDNGDVGWLDQFVVVVVVQFHGGQIKTVKLLVLKWKKKEKCTWVWWFEKVLNED